jgi:hypothetical protein
MSVKPASAAENAADRQAANQVDRSVSEQWPDGALPAGRRITVIHNADWAGPWQREFCGMIDSLGAPEVVRHPRAREGELKYWVSFDQPQYESSADGPYRKAQIWDRYIRPE